MNTQEAVASFNKIETILGKISDEQSQILADLRAALEAKGDVPVEVEQGLTRLETLADAIDQVVPDKVVDDDPAPEPEPIPEEEV